jgi:hypothetical protein
MRDRSKEQAAVKGVAWSGKVAHRGFSRDLADRAPKRAPAAAYAGAPRSITAALCGDPLPGQSALDMRRNGVAS